MKTSTSSSPRRCRRSSTSRSRPIIAATITRRRATSRRCSPPRARAIRGLVQGGGTVTPTTLLDALPEARDHLGVRRRLRRRAGRLLPQARHQGDEHARRADRRRRRRRGRADPDDGARVRAAESLRARRRMAAARPGAHDQARRAARSASSVSAASARRSPQRVAAMRHAGRVHRPQAAGRAVSRIVADLQSLAAAGRLPGRRVSGRCGDAQHGRRRRARGARHEGHADQHRARLDRRRAGAGRARWQTGTIKGAGLDVFADEPNIPAGAAGDGQRRAAAARRQRHARDAPGDGRPLQGEPRRVVRRARRC